MSPRRRRPPHIAPGLARADAALLGAAALTAAVASLLGWPHREDAQRPAAASVGTAPPAATAQTGTEHPALATGDAKLEGSPIALITPLRLLHG